jgi:hypothetical protein
MSGRRVATADAPKPMPVSHVDQMATSMVEYRKSGISLRPLMNGRRTIVAVEPLMQY